MKAQLPETMKVQCPACGVPTTATEYGRTPDDAGYGLRLTPCGHVVTVELIRDAWGIDLSDVDPRAVRHDMDV